MKTLGILQRQLAPGRNEARNFNQEQARKRLKEEVAPAYNQMQRNAVFVNGTPIRYFSKLQRGLPCSCTVKTNEMREAQVLPVPGEESTTSQMFRFDYTDTVLGTSHEVDVDGLFENDQKVLEQPPAADVNSFNPEMLLEGLFDNGIDCAICYRTRLVGGFEEVNASRNVFTHYHIKDTSGYWRDDSKSPTSFMSENLEDCWAEFECVVPKYFKDIEYQIWNNTELLNTADLHDLVGNRITKAQFQRAAGSTIRFRIDNIEEFTHVVITFKLPVNQLVADFGQDSATLDYQQLQVMAQATAVIPNTVPRADNDDVIVKLTEKGGIGSLWTVTDMNYFRLENGYQMGWTLTTRTVQPDESLFNLCKTRRVL